ncbi:MAG: PEP-CTERM sorting domain-containing protein [Pirellulales bacterium]
MTVPIHRVLTALFLGLLLVSPSMADVIDIGPPDDGDEYKIPFGVHMRADGRDWELPIEIIEGTDRRSFERIYESDVDGDGFRVMISGVLDPDPSISYAIAVTDFGAPTTFSFTFTTPIAPTSGIVSGSVSAGLTDSTGNGVSITPAVALGDPDGDTIAELQINEVGIGGPPVFTNMGVDVGGAVSFGPGLPGANHVYGPFVAGPQAGPAGVWTSLQTRISFTLSGGEDIAAVTGFASIEQIPEPSTMALVAIGVVSMLGRVALRRRKA